MINLQAPHQAPHPLRHLDAIGDQGVVQHLQLCLGHQVQGQLPLLVLTSYVNGNCNVQLPRVMTKHYICEDKNNLLHIVNECIE